MNLTTATAGLVRWYAPWEICEANTQNILFCGGGPVLSAELRKHCWIGRGMLAWRVIVSEYTRALWPGYGMQFIS